MFSHHEHVPAVSKACQPELHHLQLALPLLSPKFKNVVPCSHRDIVASYIFFQQRLPETHEILEI